MLDSFENVLNICRDMMEGKFFVVVGCGGDRDKMKCLKMVKIVVELVDELIFILDNLRSEDFCVILRDMEVGVENEYYYSIVNCE